MPAGACYRESADLQSNLLPTQTAIHPDGRQTTGHPNLMMQALYLCHYSYEMLMIEWNLLVSFDIYGPLARTMLYKTAL